MVALYEPSSNPTRLLRRYSAVGCHGSVFMLAGHAEQTVQVDPVAMLVLFAGV